MSRVIRKPGCRRSFTSRKATRYMGLDASHVTIPRGRRPCACREASCTGTERSHRHPGASVRMGRGRPQAERPPSTSLRSRMRQYYRRSRRTKELFLRRRWREGAQPRGTPESPPAPRTQSRAGASMGLDGVREVARRDRRTKFTALMHHITPWLLVESFYALRRNAAVGVDGMSWREYERNSLCAGARATPQDSSRHVPGTAIAAGLHSQSRWQTAATGNCVPGGQDRAAGGFDRPGCDLRRGLSRILVRVPGWAWSTRCVGCALQWNQDAEGELDSRPGHSGVL